jgi:UDP:flavonoid glycosyltransferase YjiC (YdhE family)
LSQRSAFFNCVFGLTIQLSLQLCHFANFFVCQLSDSISCYGILARIEGSADSHFTCIQSFISSPLPESIFMIQSADHESLFPRCSCLIHHGGAGTTHITMESGTPSIICSTFADQPFWGQRITELKIGRHIPFPTLTKENLIQAIQELNNESVRVLAAEIVNRIKAEIGLQNALDWIEKHFIDGTRL